MALLNWGNALSQAGKGLASVGLEGVKATLEQDKIRLAAKLAEESTIRGEERKWTAEQTQQPIRATWALDAVKNAKQAEIDLATDPTNIDKITKAKTLELTALDNFQTTLDKQHANDPKWVAAQKVKYDALNPYASAEAAYKNIQTSAATLKYDTDKEIKTLTAAIATETDPAKKQTLTAERDAKAWSVEGDRAERIANRQERASVGTYIASQQTELARLKQAGALDNDPDVEAIRSSLPGFQSLYKRLTEEAYPKDKVSPVVDPAAAATPGSAATSGSAATPGKPTDTLPNGARIIELPSTTRKVLNSVGSMLDNAATGVGKAKLNQSIAANASSYKAIADELNKKIAGATKEEAQLPNNYRENLKVLLGTPEYKGYLSPAALALAEKFGAEDAADKAAKPNTPTTSGEPAVPGSKIPQGKDKNGRQTYLQDGKLVY